MSVAGREESDKKPGRIPILLSAILFPGAGQAMQKRWIAAGIFAGAFIAALIVFLSFFAAVFKEMFGLISDANTYEPTELPRERLIIALVMGPFIYMVSVIDTILATMRLRSAWAIRQFLKQNQ